MESIFSRKKSTGPAKQTSLLATDVFRRVETGNALGAGTNNEEVKEQEPLVFRGVADNVNQQQVIHQGEDVVMSNPVGSSTADQDRVQHPMHMLSFEVTTCFGLAHAPENKLGTGCVALNSFFRGGLLPKRLYEVYGESGTGKTQFAIQLCLSAVLPEQLDGTALFVTAGKQLNDKRFAEMKDNFVAECSKGKEANVFEARMRDRIQLAHCNNIDEYTKLFQNLSLRIEDQGIKLVVIDNIHSVCENFIKPDGQVDYIERSAFMVRHSKLLKQLAWNFNLVIVILNNVVADVSHDGANKGFFENRSRGQSIVPSLGLNWSNCINERIALKKKGGSSNVDVKRSIVIEKSSYMRRSELDFEIVATGLRGKH